MFFWRYRGMWAWSFGFCWTETSMVRATKPSATRGTWELAEMRHQHGKWQLVLFWRRMKPSAQVTVEAPSWWSVMSFWWGLPFALKKSAAFHHRSQELDPFWSATIHGKWNILLIKVTWSSSSEVGNQTSERLRSWRAHCSPLPKEISACASTFIYNVKISWVH